jgi:hypothetical protein
VRHHKAIKFVIKSRPLEADQLGIDGVRLLAMRPDGYVGLRSDQDHLREMQQYRTLIHAGNLDG